MRLTDRKNRRILGRFETLDARCMLAIDAGFDVRAIPADDFAIVASDPSPSPSPSPDPAAVLAQVRAAISELGIDSLENLGTVHFAPTGTFAPITLGTGVHVLRPGYGSSFGTTEPAPIGWTGRNTLMGGVLTPPTVPGSFNARLVSYESPQVIDTAVILAKEVVFDGDVLELSDNITQFIVVAETIRSSAGSTIRWVGAGATPDNQSPPIPSAAPIGVPTFDHNDADEDATFDRRNGGDGFDGAAQTINGAVVAFGTTTSRFLGNGLGTLEPVDDLYNNKQIEFTSGNLAGQRSTIVDYVGLARQIHVNPPFNAVPRNGDAFRIILDTRGKRGNPGRTAPDVMFYVKQFTQEPNTTTSGHAFQASLPDLDLRGERGGRGQIGQAGGPGGNGAKGLRANSNQFDCDRGPGYGGHGGDGGNGGPGGHGGFGGAGGDILVQYVEFPADTNLQAASMLTFGGAAGFAGLGGAGGQGGQGGDAGNPDGPWCDARPGRAGNDGQDGANGPAGSLGTSGPIGSKSFQPISLATWEEAFTKPYLVRADDARVTETVVFETLNISGAAFLRVVDDRDGNTRVYPLEPTAADRYEWTIPNDMDAGTYTVSILRVEQSGFEPTNTYRIEVLPLLENIWFADEFDARPAGTAYLVGLGLRGDVEIVYDGQRILPDFLFDESTTNPDAPAPPDASLIGHDVLQFRIPLNATHGDYFTRDSGLAAHTIYLDQPFPLDNSGPISLTLKRTDGLKFLPSVNGFDFENGDMFRRAQDYVGRDGFLGGLFGQDGLGGRAYDLFRDAYGRGEVDALGGIASPLVWANYGLWYSYMVNPFNTNHKGFGFGACFGLSTLALNDFFGGIPTQDGKTVDDLVRGVAVLHQRQLSDEIERLQIAETILDAVSPAVGGPTMTEIAARYIAGFFRVANDNDGLHHAPNLIFLPSAESYSDLFLGALTDFAEAINVWDGTVSPLESFHDTERARDKLKQAMEDSHVVTPYRVVYDDPADTLPSRIYFYDNNTPGAADDNPDDAFKGGDDMYLDLYRENGRVKFRYPGSRGTDVDVATDTDGGFMLGVVPIGMPLGDVDLLLDAGLSTWGAGLDATVAIYDLVTRALGATRFLGDLPGFEVQSEQIASAGTVQFVDSHGGFYGIVADNGRRFEPFALSADLRVDGLRVQFTGTTLPEQMPHSHAWGMPIGLDLIEAINELPAAPTVTGPAAEIAGTTPEITWTAVEAAARYELQVTDLASNETVIHVPSMAGMSLTPGTPLAAGHYRVLVRGINNLSEAGEWSAPYDFEIALPTAAPGDFDHNSSVNDLDIDVLVSEISLGIHRPIYDLTGDLLVDGSDATYLVETILGTNFGDANLDRVVDAADTAVLTANFGATSGAAWRRGDFNGDAAIDLLDLAIQQSKFGLGAAGPSPSAPAAVVASQFGAIDGSSRLRPENPVAIARRTEVSSRTVSTNVSVAGRSDPDAGPTRILAAGRRPRPGSSVSARRLEPEVVDNLLTDPR